MAERDDTDWRAAAVVDTAVRLAALGLLGAWCFALLKPFIAVVVWAGILAASLHGPTRWLADLLGGRQGLAAALVTLLGIAVILGPVGLLLVNLATSIEALVQAVSQGSVRVPPPPPGIAAWPVVGDDLAAFWTEASTNLAALLERLAPRLQGVATTLLGAAAGVGLVVLQFVAAMILAGLLMPNAEVIRAGLAGFADRLTPRRGRSFIEMAAATVRNVARGVVGVAVLQGLLLGIGFLGAGIPFAGLWAIVCIVLAIVQVGPTVVVLGTLVYAWSSLATVTALLFTLWIIPMTLLDNLLRPILMARGLPVPMPVILLGVLGGTLAHGLVGLFVGPVVLSLGYELVRGWVREGDPARAPEA